MGKKLKPKPLYLRAHSQLRHWLVPHKHNDHRPHLIRLHGLALMAIMIIGVQVTANIMRPAAVRVLVHGNVLAYATDITPVDLFNQTNQQRAAAGLPALKLDSRLNSSASLKAADMFQYNYWAHVNPATGAQPWQWFTQAGYNYSYAGENLAKDFDTTSGVMTGWMNSAGHKANILNPNYTDVGFAVQNGTLQGGQTTLVVAHYGSVAGATVAANAPAPKPAATPRPAAAPVATATPAATPTLTPSPSATPTPSKSPKPVVANGSITPSAPGPQQYSLFKPLSIIRTLNFGTIVTILLLLLLLSVYVFTHLTVWRKGLRRWQSVHYRLFAAAQVSSLLVAITYLAVSGFGSVG